MPLRSIGLALFILTGHVLQMFDLSPKSMRDLLLLTLIGLITFLPGLASIPPIDRDESRYVQATVQMIETGDVIDIRFQDDARHKKPAGAYWAQLASLGITGQIDDVRRGERAIWAHRLPSTLGALIAVWATYLCGAALFGRREAFIGAGLLAVSVSLAFEAHIAKTDAMLAGASAVVLYGIAARKAWPVWLGLAAGILLKGPLLLSLAIMALVVEGVWTRSADRARSLLAPVPILTALLITVPWFVAIGLKTDGAFFAEAMGRDFGAKIAGAQETHGGPPGYYLLTLLFNFWPGIIAVPVGAIFAWRSRSENAVQLLLAWLVPFWIILEFVPTKLPHYTLILYPALTLLAGAGWVRIVDARKSRIAGYGLAGLVLALLAAIAAGTLWIGIGPILAVSVAFVLIALAGLAGYCFAQKRDGLAFLIIASFFAVVFGGALANSRLFDLTPRLVTQLPNGARVASPDYREPSLVFLAGTDTKLTRNAAPGDALILASDTPPPACAEAVGRVVGTNYAKGREMTLSVFKTEGCSAPALTAWTSAD